MHVVYWKHFNLIHHIFRCMQMDSRDEAGVGPENFNTWMEDESFEHTDSSLRKKSLVPELVNTCLILITRETKFKMDYEININNSKWFGTVQNFMFVQGFKEKHLAVVISSQSVSL